MRAGRFGWTVGDRWMFVMTLPALLLAASLDARGEEPRTPSQRTQGSYIESDAEVGVPLLSRIPYVSRLFKNVGIAREFVPVEGAPGETVERIGIDFDFDMESCPANCPAPFVTFWSDGPDGQIALVSASCACGDKCSCGKSACACGAKCGCKDGTKSDAGCKCGDACQCSKECACGDKCNCSSTKFAAIAAALGQANCEGTSCDAGCKASSCAKGGCDGAKCADQCLAECNEGCAVACQGQECKPCGECCETGVAACAKGCPVGACERPQTMLELAMRSCPAFANGDVEWTLPAPHPIPHPFHAGYATPPVNIEALQRVADLQARLEMMESILQQREQFHEAFGGMMETIVEIQIEAKDQQLELLQEMASETHELHAANARLQAQLEAVEARRELEAELLAARHENAQLRLKAEAMAMHMKLQEETARTAAAPSAKRVASTKPAKTAGPKRSRSRVARQPKGEPTIR